MKTFVLTVSKQFPKTHIRAGQDTNFVQNIKKLFAKDSKKIHTIRANFELWDSRALQINEGKAILSIRYWSDKPYNSKQIEICKLERIGIEKLTDPTNFVFANIGDKLINWETVAINDGLSFDDFCDWFKVRQKNPMAVIHFTDFKYSN